MNVNQHHEESKPLEQITPEANQQPSREIAQEQSQDTVQTQEPTKQSSQEETTQQQTTPQPSQETTQHQATPVVQTA